MRRAVAFSPVAGPDHGRNAGARVRIGPLSLLGVGVIALVTLDRAEHERRTAAGIAAVTDPALLDRLLDLPAGVSVADAGIWVETADQPGGVVERGDDGCTITRRLVPPLAIDDVIVAGGKGRELRAVQEASLFAAFNRRWIAVARCLPDAVVLEAKLVGVGVMDAHGNAVLDAEMPVSPTMDGWAWLLREKAYRQWLSEQPRERVMGSQAPATGESSVIRAG